MAISVIQKQIHNYETLIALHGRVKILLEYNSKEKPNVYNLSRLLDVRSLSVYMDISEKTAYNLVRRRDFPSFKVGGQYRVLVDELKQWMERQTKAKKS